MIVGVLGAGQLGRMLALAGYPLGLRFRFLDPAPAAPAGQLAEQIAADFEDRAALERFAAGLDVVTYEFENVPVAAARDLTQYAPVYPPPVALEVAQDRLVEKKFFRSLGIPTPAFVAVETCDALAAAIATTGLPAVLKTRRFGYDGKGQYVLREPADIEHAWEALGGVPLILEGFVPFERELSILAARGRDGATAIYPPVENRHRDGILHISRAPAPGLTPELRARAESYISSVLDALSYVGVLAIELFEVRGELVANELAPRVHNSGHWTIEGAETSQFANHIRAVAGLPLGSPAAIGCSAMVNLIGTVPERAAVLTVEGAHLHLYGKTPRPARKLGHVTVRADEPRLVDRQLARVLELVG